MKTYFVAFTIFEDGHEFGEYIFLKANNQEEAEANAEVTAEKENKGESPFNLLHDHTCQVMSIDSVKELTKREEEVLKKYIYAKDCIFGCDFNRVVK